MDTYAEPGPSGISSYDDDNDTDMVLDVHSTVILIY